MNRRFTQMGTRPLRRALGALPAVLSLLGLGMAGCDKSIDVPQAQALVPASSDATGGAWKPVFIQGDTMVTLPVPAEPGSAAYMADLQEIKTLQSSITSGMSSDISYWSAGAVLRWNEIARSLVIKYNVAPPVGTPPNPLKPFATPPFASRAYALLSVAQYNALVYAWSNKFSHNRQAPARNDGAIKTLAPVPDLPSYPSEHAVVAAASAEILKFFFPADSAYIFQRAKNHQESRIWAGANVRSEIAAADSLGRLVAQRVIAYAKTDGASKARGGDSLFTDKNKWVSLETPVRPPMLPLWGQVRLWITPNVEAARPDPPPAIGSAEFAAAVAEVRKYSDNRTREEWRIADYWADGAGTSTPPGHWNIIATELIQKYKLSEIRTARTLALLNMAMMDGGVCCWDVKYLYVVPRPSQMDPEIKTSTGIPNFPSYTSGHSTFSAAAAQVLSYIFPADEARIRKDADEAAISRLYGGIHYRFDCDAGFVCGTKIGQYVVDYARQDGAPNI